MNLYKQLDEFMVTWTPRIWRSRILLLVGITIVTSFLFGQLKGGGLLEEVGEEAFIMVSITLGFYWIYLQYKHQPFLRKFSLGEILLGSLLNLLCVILIFVPLYFIEDFYRSGNQTSVDSFFDATAIFFYFVGLPLVFMPFIVRNYTFTEILLIIVGGFLVGAIIIILANTMGAGDPSETMSWVFFLFYLVLMIKVIVALAQRRYGRWDKWIIFFLLSFGPFVITFSYSHFLGEGPYYKSGNVIDLNLDEASNITDYFYNWVISFVVLLVFTWYVTRSFEKPMRMK